MPRSDFDNLPKPGPPRISDEQRILNHLRNMPLIQCHIGRRWLVGWKEIGAYCGFAKGKGSGAGRTGRKWEVYYGMPIHRLPDQRPRAIPYELDQWLIAYDTIRRAENEKTTKQLRGKDG